jgi:hypothetical protein
VTAKSWIVY